MRHELFARELSAGTEPSDLSDCGRFHNRPWVGCLFYRRLKAASTSRLLGVFGADKNAVTIDGEKRDLTVILKFQSQEDVMKLYEDPEYKPWLDIRLASTTNRATIMVGEFDLSTY